MTIRLASISLSKEVSDVSSWRFEDQAYIHRLGYTKSHDGSFVTNIGGSNAMRTALVIHVLIHVSVDETTYAGTLHGADAEEQDQHDLPRLGQTQSHHHGNRQDQDHDVRNDIEHTDSHV
jgi:hypothetical protein